MESSLLFHFLWLTLFKSNYTLDFSVPIKCFCFSALYKIEIFIFFCVFLYSGNHVMHSIRQMNHMTVIAFFLYKLLPTVDTDFFFHSFQSALVKGLDDNKIHWDTSKGKTLFSAPTGSEFVCGTSRIRGRREGWLPTLVYIIQLHSSANHHIKSTIVVSYVCRVLSAGRAKVFLSFSFFSILLGLHLLAFSFCICRLFFSTFCSIKRFSLWIAILSWFLLIPF